MRNPVALFICALLVLSGVVINVAAQGFNPYLELPTDPKAMQERGIEVRYDSSRDTYRFIFMVGTPSNEVRAPISVELAVARNKATASGRPDLIVSSQWISTNGNCTGNFVISKDVIEGGVLYIKTSQSSYVLGLAAAAKDAGLRLGKFDYEKHLSAMEGRVQQTAAPLPPTPQSGP